MVTSSGLVVFPFLFCVFHKRECSFSIGSLSLPTMAAGGRSVGASLLPTRGSPVNTTVTSFCRHRGTSELHMFSSRFSRSRVPIGRLFHGTKRVPLLRHATLTVTAKAVLSMNTKDNYRTLTLRRDNGRISSVSVSPLSIRIVGLQKIGSTHRIGLFSRHFTRAFSAVLVLVGNSNVVKHLRGVPLFFHGVGRLLHPSNYVLVSSDSLHCLFRSRSNDFLVSLTKSCCKRVSFHVRCGSVRNSPFS